MDIQAVCRSNKHWGWIQVCFPSHKITKTLIYQTHNRTNGSLVCWIAATGISFVHIVDSRCALCVIKPLRLANNKKGPFFSLQWATCNIIEMSVGLRRVFTAYLRRVGGLLDPHEDALQKCFIFCHLCQVRYQRTVHRDVVWHPLGHSDGGNRTSQHIKDISASAAWHESANFYICQFIWES